MNALPGTRIAIGTALVAIVALAVVLVLGRCSGVKGPPQSAMVEIAGERFDLELALDIPSRARGLMERSEIPAHGGMLFVFPAPAVQSFWMYDCLVDIDLIFLDPRGRVTALHAMTVEPPRREDEPEFDYGSRLAGYPSVYPAQFAIELQAGSIERLGLRVENKIELDLPRLKALAD